MRRYRITAAPRSIPMPRLTGKICLLHSGRLYLGRIPSTGVRNPSNFGNGCDMHDLRVTWAPALATLEDITEFACMVVAVADSVHATLKRLSASSAKDLDVGYSVLTEEYALRARANILLNDSARHTVKNAGFNQADLRRFIAAMDKRIKECRSMADLLSASSDLITFASAVSSGNVRILGVLAQAFGVVGAGRSSGSDWTPPHVD